MRAGTDDEIGKLYDVYFDDVSWKVLFLVTDTRPWLLGRFVLVSPAMLGSLQPGAVVPCKVDPNDHSQLMIGLG